MDPDQGCQCVCFPDNFQKSVLFQNLKTGKISKCPIFEMCPIVSVFENVFVLFSLKAPANPDPCAARLNDTECTISVESVVSVKCVA